LSAERRVSVTLADGMAGHLRLTGAEEIATLR
jgi:hypothetical protein